MSNCPIALHELLVMLWRDEQKAKEKTQETAGRMAVKRTRESDEFSAEDRAFLDDVHKGKRKIREAHGANPNLYTRYLSESIDIYKEDRKSVV